MVVLKMRWSWWCGGYDEGGTVCEGGGGKKGK